MLELFYTIGIFGAIALLVWFIVKKRQHAKEIKKEETSKARGNFWRDFLDE